MTDQKISRQITSSFTKRHNLAIAYVADSGTTEIPAADPFGSGLESKYFDVSAGAIFFNCPEVVEGEDLQLSFRLWQESTIHVYYTGGVAPYSVESSYRAWSYIEVDGVVYNPPITSMSREGVRVSTTTLTMTANAGVHVIKILGYTTDANLGAKMTWVRLTLISSDLINE